MKIIPKILSGGGIPPLTYYTPVGTAPSTILQPTKQSTSNLNQDESNNKGELTNKDYLESLKDINGLPNDMLEVFKAVGKYYLFKNLFDNQKIDTTSISSRFLATLNKIKLSNFNKEEYDKAEERVISQGGLNEIAITNLGKIVVLDKEGNMKLITSDEYLNNQDKYLALTNSNLLWLRAHDPKFSYQNEVLGVVNNGIGILPITKMIEDTIANLGTSEITKTGYSYKQKDRIIKGVELLQEAVLKGSSVEGMTLDGLYKNKLVTEDLYKQISAAILYIYSTLPTNARVLLEVKSGNSTNPLKGALDLITSLITSKSSTVVDLDNNFLEELDVNGNKVDTSKSLESSFELNSAGKFLMGAGYKEDYVINPKTSYSYIVRSTSMPLIKSNGDYISSNNTLLDAVDGEYSPILDKQNISMGMKKIDPINFSKIILSDGNINSIDFPIDMKRYIDTGDIIPDLRADTIENKKKADRELVNMGINLSDRDSISKNISVVNDTYKKYNLPPAYNNDGTPTKNWARFGVINAQASNLALGMEPLEDNPYLEEITDEAKIDLLILLTKEENFDKENFYEISALGGEWDDYYKGTLWVPIKVSYVNATANKRLNPKDLHELLRKEESLNSRLTKEQPK